ncbi:sensor domain-containing diguanylate cyclase [Sphingomonas sp. RB1R13]|uniref:sensor domain-containing diguanylate cyclase n=1 Tax=Sphingomonas sp. RB1R13 TaxID=3096159 RepID=UPI002FCA5F57
MNFVHRLRPVAPIGIAYFLAAVVSLFLAKLNNGVPFLWLPASIMFACLRVRARGDWAPTVVVCAIALFMVSGLLEGRWLMAGPMTAFNMTEGLAGAWFLTRARAFHNPLGSVGWMLEFVIPIGLIAPGVVSGLAWVTCYAFGIDGSQIALQLFCGHAIGNLMFTPLTRLVARDGFASIREELLQHGLSELVGLVAAVAVVTIVVFCQSATPLLFLPFVPMILLAFRLGFPGSVIGLMIIAAIAGAFTVHGYGPVNLMNVDTDLQIHFLQFYLVAIVLTVLPVAADLKNRTDLLRTLQLSEQRYRLVAEYSDDILMHLELDGRIRYVSPSISRITGFEAADLNGSVARNLVVPEALGVVRQGHLATLAARGKTHSYEYLAKTTTGKQLWLETRGRALIDENGVIESTLCIIRDVTARKEAERELSDAALTDPLTGLPNRRSFEGEVKRRAAEAVSGESDCVAMFDIDRFKLVNDRFGHDAGDAVLQTFARVLRNVIRQDDIIARLGGEEFAVLFPCTEVPQALLVCERLREEMGQTLTEVGSQIIGVTVSGGVSMLGPRGLEHALKQADRALYTAKRGGRDQMALAA